MEKHKFQGFDLPGSRKILAYLLEMPAQIVARGLELVRRGAMREAWWKVPDHVLHGEVQGGQRYVQTVVLGPKWVDEVWCSCPYGSDCKHVFALLETLTVQWPTRASTGKKPAPRAAGVRSPLATHLAGRLGRALNIREANLVRDIENVWKANYAGITEQRLLQLAGHTEYFYEWQKSEAALWSPHRPPASAIEAFYYLADALRDRKRLPNTPAFSTID